MANYGSPERENAAARCGLTLADVSASAKLEIQGRDVSEIARALLGDGAGTRIGSVSSIDLGGPTLACRPTTSRLLLLGSMPNAAPLHERVRSVRGIDRVILNDVTNAYAAFSLSGPTFESLLRRLTAIDVSSSVFAEGSCAETNLAGVEALLVRPPTCSRPRILIRVGWDVGEYLWETLVHTGSGLDLTTIAPSANEFSAGSP